MTLEEAIYGRRSVRKFKSIIVPDNIIHDLIDAAIQAPSACNLQGWKFLVIREDDRKIFNNSVLFAAPVVLVVAYRNDLNYMSGFRHKDYVQSAAAAIENLLLMAYQKGLGACWVCDIPDNCILQSYFNLPDNYEVLAAIALGYSDEESNTIGQKLFHGLNEKFFDNHVRRYSVEECTYFEKYNADRDDVHKTVTDNISGNAVRDYWVRVMLKIARPVLENCSQGSLHDTMPLPEINRERARRYAHLEALGRTLLGISPWLENETYSTELERELKDNYRIWTRKSIANATNPASRDYMNWDVGDQPLVDTAFLCLGILQARTQLWDKLDEQTKSNFLTAIKSTRKIVPWRSNWILFSAMVEVFLFEVAGESECIKSVIDYGISQFEQWYIGDGFYKDGDNFHFDYYESIVIHPFLIEIAERIPWIKSKDKYRERALRYCKILESFIGDDGCYPLIGRSLCYRGGVLHILAKMAVRGEFSVCDEENINVSACAVRTSLTNVLHRIMSGKIFDENGWLKLGIVGEQFALAEEYINTGSLYMFLAMFMVTAIEPENIFWTGGKQKDFSGRIWNGEDLQFDSALEGWRRL